MDKKYEIQSIERSKLILNPCTQIVVFRCFTWIVALLNFLGLISVSACENSDAESAVIDLTEISQNEFREYLSNIRKKGVKGNFLSHALPNAVVKNQRSDLISEYLQWEGMTGEDRLMFAIVYSSDIDANRRSIVGIMRSHLSLEDPPLMVGNQYIPSMAFRDSLANQLIRDLLPGLLDQISKEEFDVLFKSRGWRTEIAELLEKKLNGETFAYEPLVPALRSGDAGIENGRPAWIDADEERVPHVGGGTAKAASDVSGRRVIGVAVFISLGAIGLVVWRYWKRARM